MGLHLIKKLLHKKKKQMPESRDNHRMGEIFASYSSDKGLISRYDISLYIHGTQNIKNQKNK
jgi:hypothetical protein